MTFMFTKMDMKKDFTSENKEDTMKTNIYAFRDTKIGFMQPFLQQNEAVAMRTLKMAVNDEHSQIRNMAEDIQLYQLGNFDDDTGEIMPEVKFIANAIDHKEVNSNRD